MVREVIPEANAQTLKGHTHTVCALSHPRSGALDDSAQDAEQAVQPAFVDGHHGLRAYCGFGVVSHR